MSFSAPSALGVHSDGAMGAGRSKGKNGFEYAYDDDEVVIYDVPLFDAHEDSGRPEPFNKIDEDRLNEIAKHTRWQEKAGRYPRLIVGHTSDEKPDEYMAIFGRAENVHVKRSKDIEGHPPTIYSDWRVDRNFFESELAAGRFPGRSVEIELPDKDNPNNGFFISNIAALRATPPARPLKDMGRFQRYEKNPKRDGFTVSRLLEEKPIMAELSEDRLKELLAEAYAKGAKDAQKFTKGSQHYEHGESCDCEECKEKYAAEEEEGKESDKESKPKRGRPAKASKDSDAAKYAAMESRVAAAERDAADTKAALEAVKAERRAESVRYQVETWERQGYGFGTPEERGKEIERLASITDPAAYSAECARIQRFYTKAPVGARVDVSHLTTGTTGGEAYSDKLEKATRQYMKDNKGVPYWKASEAVANSLKDGSLTL